MGGDDSRLVADRSALLPHAFVQPLVQTPPLSQCEVCVIVPVRNEAEMVVDTLKALAHQVDLSDRALAAERYEIILLANNCSDGSAKVARRFARQHPALVLHVVERTLPVEEAYIGRVRQLLMDEAYHRLTLLGRRRGIIASTDGDTRVATDWIAATLHEIASGADAVGGRIVTDRADRAKLNPYAKACYLREVGYRSLVAELESYLDPDSFDPRPRHYQHYGASFAVTAEAYRRAGGLPPVRSPEDVALYRALVRVNARFRHSPLVRVTTSARQVGRTCNGLANQLNQWVTMGQQQQPFLVESAAAITARFEARQALRNLWRRRLGGDRATAKDAALLAHKFGVATQWLAKELMQPHSFGALFEQVERRQQEEGIWQQRWSLVKIERAIADLRLSLDRLRREPLPKRSHMSTRLQPLGQLLEYPKFVQTDRDDTVLPFDQLDAVV